MALTDLQKRLEALEVEQKRQEKEVSELTSLTIIRTQKVETKNGFVIRLEFGAGAPVSEWSDETHGWRSQDLGTRYSTEQLAQERFSELKQKWPDYPLKIHFSSGGNPVK